MAESARQRRGRQHAQHACALECCVAYPGGCAHSTRALMPLHYAWRCKHNGLDCGAQHGQHGRNRRHDRPADQVRQVDSVTRRRRRPCSRLPRLPRGAYGGGPRTARGPAGAPRGAAAEPWALCLGPTRAWRGGAAPRCHTEPPPRYTCRVTPFFCLRPAEQPLERSGQPGVEPAEGRRQPQAVHAGHGGAEPSEWRRRGGRQRQRRRRAQPGYRYAVCARASTEARRARPSANLERGQVGVSTPSAASEFPARRPPVPR